jgi:hypothetical protein
LLPALLAVPCISLFHDVVLQTRVDTASLKAATLSLPMGSAARLQPMLRILNIPNQMADADSSTLLLSDASC